MEKESKAPPGAGSKVPVGADLVIPALALAFAAYFFVSIAGLGWEASANGVLIGSLLVVLAAVQVVRTGIAIAKGRGSADMTVLLYPREALVKRIGMIAIAAAFVGAMYWLGFTLALFTAMLAALYLMGVRRAAPLVGTPLVCAALAYVMFIVVLKAEFPHGPVEHLLGVLF